MAHGRLYLVPTPLDFGCDIVVPLADVLPAGTIAVAAGLTHWICENAKSARAFLKRVGELQPLALPLQQQAMQELPRAVHKKGDHGPTSFDARPLLQPALEGQDVGLLSEAGMPAVADPGSSVVRAAHDLGIEVVPLVGPVSLLLALAASGLNGQNFAFVGYLPQDPAARTQRLRELEALALRSGQTQMFIETPYRNAAVWDALLQGLKPATRVAVASGLTLPAARSRSSTVAAWKKEGVPISNDTPAVFAIGG
ncbi:SAM-dependent methyltransferase [Ramlibacter sp.]|uniref:SAM-dependent methyltransferase n=1 Tax=Ramlibacter sp. TaxID=1917967 RepID=UPI0026288757|nr:SAM-dependent methyltransferase [Ramlibacter sp.]MDB5953485.1 Uroporphyrin-III methyltransferase [Ramlibacter sp.]